MATARDCNWPRREWDGRNRGDLKTFAGRRSSFSVARRKAPCHVTCSFSYVTAIREKRVEDIRGRSRVDPIWTVIPFSWPPAAGELPLRACRPQQGALSEVRLCEGDRTRHGSPKTPSSRTLFAVDPLETHMRHASARKDSRQHGEQFQNGTYHLLPGGRANSGSIPLTVPKTTFARWPRTIRTM
jgi:hypothetical protein